MPHNGGNGKTNARRPKAISEVEFDENWSRAFKDRVKKTNDFVQKVEKAHKDARKSKLGPY